MRILFYMYYQPQTYHCLLRQTYMCNPSEKDYVHALIIIQVYMCM